VKPIRLSVLLGQQNGSHRSVGLGDDPDASAVPELLLHFRLSVPNCCDDKRDNFIGRIASDNNVPWLATELANQLFCLFLALTQEHIGDQRRFKAPCILIPKLIGTPGTVCGMMPTMLRATREATAWR